MQKHTFMDSLVPPWCRSLQPVKLCKSCVWGHALGLGGRSVDAAQQEMPRSLCRDHQITHLGRIKQCKCIVILGDFPYNSALFGLVI